MSLHGILEAQGAALDRAYIERWVRELGLEALWVEVCGQSDGQR